jgi:tetratricopeptide (TPR) repeat protein
MIYLRWVREQPAEAMDFNGLGTASIFGWLQRWEESNEWLNECQRSIPDYDKTPEWQQTYWHLRCRSLRETKRYSELLAAADSLQEVLGPDHDGILPISVRICALAGLGRYEELLRRLHSSYYDSVSMAWFWRMVAHAKLGNAEKCIECFEQYEAFVGPDLYATQFLAHELKEIMPLSDPQQDEE